MESFKSFSPQKAHPFEDNSSVVLHVEACHSVGGSVGADPHTWSFSVDILRFCDAPLPVRSGSET